MKRIDARPMLERWLAARDAESVRSAWTALAPRRHEFSPRDRTITLHGAALLAEAMLGERADWIVDVLVRRAEFQSRRDVDACFLDDAWDVNQPCRETWDVHEQRDASRGVQVVMVGVGSTSGQPDGSSETVVRIFDRDRAVSARIGANYVATIGEIDLALLDLLWISHPFLTTNVSTPVALPTVDIEPVIAPPRDPNVEHNVWEWDVSATFNPHYDATASAEGLSYHCEIQGPFCGYDRVGAQTWDEFLAVGPLANVQMPSSIAAEIRAYAIARTPRR